MVFIIIILLGRGTSWDRVTPSLPPLISKGSTTSGGVHLDSLFIYMCEHNILRHNTKHGQGSKVHELVFIRNVSYTFFKRRCLNSGPGRRAKKCARVPSRRHYMAHFDRFGSRRRRIKMPHTQIKRRHKFL